MEVGILVYYPSEKILEFVHWDDELPQYMGENSCSKASDLSDPDRSVQ